MTELKIEGMTCNHCVASVRTALEGVAGVNEVKIDLDSGHAEVAGEANAARLIAAVTESGYRASLAD